ncbi:MAG: PIG-L family deacetylase [Gemmatimonadaceae bacterium]
MTRASVKRAAILAVAVLVAAPRLVTAQADRERGAAALGELIRGLGVTARVLMIGAHPDDEDTNLITWLARGRGVETAYLSLTRGDGGQNLIGNELGEALGVIRTEELLAARRIDGGRQYFTRAYDFGFSKSAEETYRHWPKDSILRDVVTVVRAFKPHVIIAVFTGTPRDGHGHHQVSGLLAREAYDVAGDTVRMPTSINAWHLPPWTPLKFYRSSRFAPDSATLRFNVGEYDPLIGRSYAEIAAESRSQHKSQGFGALQRRGVVWDYLRREATRVNAQQEARSERSLFEGIDTTIAGLKREERDPRFRAAIEALDSAVRGVQRATYWRDPAAAVPLLAEVMTWTFAGGMANMTSGMIDSATNTQFDPSPAVRAAYDQIGRRAQRALRLATGVAVDAEVERELVAEGDSTRLTLAVYNRGGVPLRAGPAEFFGCPRGEEEINPRRTPRAERRPPAIFDSGGTILPDSVRVWRAWLCGAAGGSPRWLQEPRIGDMFEVGPALVSEGEVEEERTLLVDFALTRGEGAGWPLFQYEPRIVRRFADPVRGEVRRPVAIVPEISVLLDRSVELARANVPLDRMVRVHLRSAATAPRDVSVQLRAAAGLTVDSATRTLSLPPGGTATVTFRLRGRLRPGQHRLAAAADAAGHRYTVGYTTIDYEHIRPRRMFRPAITELVAADVAVPAGLTVAYLPGVSDNVAPAIEQLGIPVTLVDAAALPQLDPARTPVLVIGPRAYEANDTLVTNAAAVLAFARRGGTVVVQYGQHEMTQPGIMPYPVTIERRADRVTEEDAPVRVLDSASRVLTYPNRISDRDFAGWVQERALYMPRTFDARYHAPLSMNDPGEPPNQGAILVVPVGRGTYVYTTLAFFRQLPAGHPGAARLFVNLLAAGQRPAAR